MRVVNNLASGVVSCGVIPSSHAVAAITRESAVLEDMMEYRRGANLIQPVHRVRVCVGVCVCNLVCVCVCVCVGGCVRVCVCMCV